MPSPCCNEADGATLPLSLTRRDGDDNDDLEGEPATAMLRVAPEGVISDAPRAVLAGHDAVDT